MDCPYPTPARCVKESESCIVKSGIVVSVVILLTSSFSLNFTRTKTNPMVVGESISVIPVKRSVRKEKSHDFQRV